MAAVNFLTGHTNDIAEYYYSSEALETGDIVYALGGARVAKATTTTIAALGAVSTKPGLELGAELPTPEGTSRYPVGLIGRIPVKVSTENGAIRIGDEITLSDIGGTGMRYGTTTGNTIVGIALEDFDGTGEYLSQGVVETETIMVATGTPVCTKTLVHNDSKAGGGSAIEGGEISSGSSSDSYIETCTQEKVAVPPENYSASSVVARGNPVKVGKILMFISLRKAHAPTALYSTDSSGKWYIDAEGNVQAETIQAKNIVAEESLEVGTPEAPVGMTLYDLSSKKPYCLYISGGSVMTVPGKCAAVAPAPAPSTPPTDTAVPADTAPPPPEETTPTESAPSESAPTSDEPPVSSDAVPPAETVSEPPAPVITETTSEPAPTETTTTEPITP